MLNENSKSYLSCISKAEPLDGFAGGTEWVIDARDCDPQRLREVSLIESLCRCVIEDLGLTVVGRPQLHAFPGPGGVTALYLLSESHLACHTYPEYAFATFNLYCCRRRPAWDWSRHLKTYLDAADTSVREIQRSHRRREPAPVQREEPLE